MISKSSIENGTNSDAIMVAEDKCSNSKVAPKESTSSPLVSPRVELSDCANENGYSYTISQSTISGVLHMHNTSAIDWSPSGLIAYGCQNRIIVVDTNHSMTFRQTLHRHKHVVSLIRWSPLTNHLCLASVDINGVIIIWNVVESTTLTVILSTNETKSVNFFHWIYLDRHSKSNAIINTTNFGDSSWCNTKLSTDSTSFAPVSATNLFLLVFNQQVNTFTIFDAELGEPIAKWTPDLLVSNVSYNPFFQFNRTCDNSMTNLLLGLRPISGEDRIYLAIARLNESDLCNESSKEPKKLSVAPTLYCMQSSDVSSRNRSFRYDVITRVEKAKVNPQLFTENIMSHLSNQGKWHSSSNESYIQLEHHRAVRNQVFVVFTRDIYLIDLSIECIVTIIPIERNCSKLIRIFSCAQRNSFYAFHETGNVSFRFYQKKVIRDRSNQTQSMLISKSSTNNESSNVDTAVGQQCFLNVGYINLCQSESIRLTKQNKIFGYSVSPSDETRVAFLLSSGRIVVKSLICQKMIQNEEKSLLSYIVNQEVQLPYLSDMIKPQEYKLGAFLVLDTPDEPKSLDSIFYKLIVTNFLSGLNSLPTVIRMCPPLTLQNLSKHKPLLAVGDSLGLIQIWLLNGNTAHPYREFSVHSYPIAGIEWTSLNSLISYSYPSITSPSHHSTANHALSAFNLVSGSGSSSGKVTNELVYLEITTGRVTPFRTNRIHDSSPIEAIRVSHLKQYLIILFKRDDPFEIWDVKSLTLLRVMSKNMTNISAVEWSPLYNKKHMTKQSSETENKHFEATRPIKENFIVTSRELYHFSIEGNLVRELACIPPDAESGNVNVTSIAWKSDQVLLGDASGTLNVWDLKRKVSRTEATYRSCIRKIRFGPGRGNMKCLILYSDYGVDIWDINEFRLCAQLKYPRDINFKIIDLDWASCDLPILSTAEGFIFITDCKLKTYSSPISFEADVKRNDILLNEQSKEKFCNFDPFGIRPDLIINTSFISFDLKKHLVRDCLFHISYKLCTTSEDDSEGNSRSSMDIRKYINSQILMSKLFKNPDDFDFWSILCSILFSDELDSRLDLFLDSTQFRHLQQEKLMLLEANRKTYSHACHAYQLNLRLRNFHRAVQILLETESFLSNSFGEMNENPRHNVFYVDALKACLIASLQSEVTDKVREMNRSATDSCDTLDLTEDESSAGPVIESDCQLAANDTKVAPVVKLVATSLIANGHILEGVELLNFISKTSDSCRYLQSCEKWLESVWLAKSSLDSHECTEVMRRWCEHLLSSKCTSDQQTAVKMYLSRRQFSRVLRTLNRLGDLKAFPFAVICIGAQLIDIEANRDILEEIFDRFVSFFFDFDAFALSNIKNGSLSHEGGDVCNSTIDKDISLSLQNCWSFFTGTNLFL